MPKSKTKYTRTGYARSGLIPMLNDMNWGSLDKCKIFRGLILGGYYLFGLCDVKDFVKYRVTVTGGSHEWTRDGFGPRRMLKAMDEENSFILGHILHASQCGDHEMEYTIEVTIVPE